MSTEFANARAVLFAAVAARIADGLNPPRGVQDHETVMSTGRIVHHAMVYVDSAGDVRTWAVSFDAAVGEAKERWHGRGADRVRVVHLQVNLNPDRWLQFSHLVPAPDLPLSYDRTLALLREVIAEFGEDHIAPWLELAGIEAACRYVIDGEPSCIVGQVFYRAGVPIAELEAIEGIGADDLAAAPQLRDWADNRSLLLLGLIQEEQDNGRPWGVALSNALELLEGRDG